VSTKAELEGQLRLLENQIQNLRREVERRTEDSDEVLVHLDRPLSFVQILTITGMPDRELKDQLDVLSKAGKVLRWDLPRWVRADLPARDKLRLAFSEMPLRQHEIEALSGLRRGQVSGQITELQEEGLVKLGEKKGDPWFLPPAEPGRALARGTQYQLHRPRRGPKGSAHPKRKPPGQKDET
jgi:hypothetical protein